MASPLKQFEIKEIYPIELFGYDISFTNSSLFMSLALILAILLFYAGSHKKAMIPGRLQMFTESIYMFVANILKSNVGVEGRRYFPLIFCLFIYILFGNLLGLLPYSFTFTSHIIVTFAMAFSLFILITFIGFYKHGLHYFNLFLPKGLPWWLAPIIFVIEVISYFVRPFSLSLRLTANMMAGHILLKVIASFIFALGVFGIFPFAFLFVMTGFEIFIAFLHAYIFTLLTCIYLNDAVNMH